MADNYIQNQLKTQLATRSGTLVVRTNDGGYHLVDENTGQSVTTTQFSSTLLSAPPQSTDPQLNASDIDIARGYLSGQNLPYQLIESFASVAAYTSSATGIPIRDLFPDNQIGLQLIQAYNTFKPKSSQIGIFGNATTPNWANNITLRGSVFEALIPTITIVSKTLPLPILNKRYEQTIETSGGKFPLTFTIDSGLLPEGLLLNNIYNAAINAVECTITGIPTKTGDYNFTIAVSDIHKQTTKQSYSGTVLVSAS